jgi:hypothetical protein
MADGLLARVARQSALEQRVRAWWLSASTPADRALRLGIVLSPLALGLALAIPICPAALLARVPCPGCGLTRAAWALISGDLARAIALNPLGPIVCPLLIAGGGFAMLRYVARGRIDADRWFAGPVLVVIMLALTIVWALRFAGYFGGPVAI